MPQAKGQGAHTLREPRKTPIFGGWWTALDRWGAIPRGYGIMVCGCRRANLLGQDVGAQKWILPRHPWRGKAPVSSPTGREGDLHAECGQSFTRIYPT